MPEQIAATRPEKPWFLKAAASRPDNPSPDEMRPESSDAPTGNAAASPAPIHAASDFEYSRSPEEVERPFAADIVQADPAAEDPALDEEGEDTARAPGLALVPESGPPAFHMFRTMCSRAGLASAPDNAGNDLLATSWENLPQQTRDAFACPEADAHAHAKQMFSAFRSHTPESQIQQGEGGPPAGAGTHLVHALGQAIRKGGSLMRRAMQNDPQRILHWQASRARAARERASRSLDHLEKIAQQVTASSEAALIGRMNDLYQEGMRSGNPAQMTQAVSNLRQALPANFVNQVSEGMDDAETAIADANEMGVLDDSWKADAKARMESLRNGIGVMLTKDNRTLYERMSKLIQTIFQAVKHLFQRNGTGPSADDPGAPQDGPALD